MSSSTGASEANQGNVKGPMLITPGTIDIDAHSLDVEATHSHEPNSKGYSGSIGVASEKKEGPSHPRKLDATVGKRPTKEKKTSPKLDQASE